MCDRVGDEKYSNLNVLQAAETPPPAQPPMPPDERQQDNRVAATTPQSYHLPSKMKRERCRLARLADKLRQEKKLATRIRLNGPRPANLRSSKTVFFNPESCILLTKVIFLKINTGC